MRTERFWPAGALLAAVLTAAGCGHESAASTGARPGAAPELAQTSAPVGASSDAHAAQPDSTATALSPAAAAPDSAAREQSAAQQATAAPQAQRPRADRTPARPGDAEKISFDDLNLGMSADMVFRPFLINDRVQQLDGQRVSIIGYMHGGVESTKNIKEFVLLKNTECKFGPGGQADHLAQVFLKPDAATVFTKKQVKVEGTLKVEPFQGVDGNTWSIYRLEDAKVVP